MKKEKILKHIARKKEAIQNSLLEIEKIKSLPDGVYSDRKEQFLASEMEILEANKKRLAELEEMYNEI